MTDPRRVTEPYTATEATRKSLTARLKGSGMKRDGANAEAIMALEALTQSDQWTTTGRLSYGQQSEYSRNSCHPRGCPNSVAWALEIRLNGSPPRFSRRMRRG